jgi:hypothetical protein
VSHPTSNNVYGVANGTTFTSTFVEIFQPRPPDGNDIQYQVQQRWWDSLNNEEYILTGFTSIGGNLQAVWQLISSAASGVQDLTGNTGGPVGPDGSQNINVVGDGTSITVAGNPSTHTLTISAIAGAAGILTLTGNSGGAVSPDVGGNVNTVGDGTTITAVGNPGTNTISFSTAGSVATSYIEDTGTATPTGGMLRINGQTNIIDTVGSGNTVTINAGPVIATSYVEDTGTAVPATNVLHIVGGTGISTAGAGSTVTITSTATETTYSEDSGTATPSAGTLNIHGTTGVITTSGAGNTVTINAGATVATSYVEDTGTAVPAGSVLNIKGGTGITTSGTGDTVTITNSATATVYDANTGSATPLAGVLNIHGTGVITTTGSGNTLTISSSGGAGFSAVNIQTFTASGTYTPTTNMQYCVVEVIGGGGGAGGAPASGVDQFSLGGSGSGGEYARGVFTATTIGASQTVTIGAGGTGGTGAVGSGGNTTSLGTLITCVGGAGGNIIGPSTSNELLGIAGGTGGTGGNFRMPGDSTCPINAFFYIGVGGFASYSNGGDSFYGSGGIFSNISGPGGNGTGYGAGGGGVINSPSTAASTGGNGTNGLVIVTEYIS